MKHLQKTEKKGYYNEDFFVTYKDLLFIPDEKDFLVKAYNDLLGREPDKEGFEYYLSNLDNKKSTKKDIIKLLENSEEYKSKKQEKNILYEINKKLPKNIDWNKGAKTYLSELIKDQGKSAEIYHYIKPFIGGPDYSTFFDEMYRFLNMVEILDLEMRSTILEVGCGPGWICQYLSKLGFEVLGIDISEDLIDIAKKRIKNDSISPYENNPLSVDFIVHDIEDNPLKVNTQFDVAIFEATLHHFYNPILVIKNVSKNFKKDGLIVIMEGIAPDTKSIYWEKCLDIMKKYHTLERPYTRDQLIKILKVTGYKYFQFYSSVNGFFEQDQSAKKKIEAQLLDGVNKNIVIASRTDESIRRISKQ